MMLNVGTQAVAVAAFAIGLAAFLPNFVQLRKLPGHALAWLVGSTLMGISCWTIAIVTIVLAIPANS